MKNKALLHLFVGLFVLFGVACIFYLAFQVSGLDPSSGEPTYQLKAEFTDIGGLRKRSKVSVAGVNVGKVLSITINPVTQNALVAMQINKTANYLTTDTSARILTAGLLGEKYIGLLSGSDEELLTDGDMIEDTQGALLLENIISDFLVNSGKKDNE